MKKWICLVLLTFAFAACGLSQPKGSGKPVSHKAWTTLLKKHVNEAGWVNYKGFIKDKAEMQSYLDMLSTNPPASNWSNEEKLAYWFNAYNAFTIKLIMDHYPVKGIKEIGPKTQVIFINTPWDKKFFKIGGEKMSLNNIEHGILRKKFDEPRLHFAVNCASVSCPKLMNEAYEADKLDKQLDQQAREFLSDKSRNIVDANNPKLSKIFDWYGGDFKHKGMSRIQYINQFSPVKINEKANIQYLDYNWNLNEQK